MPAGQIGFKANLTVDDGGTGASPGATATAVPGLTVFTLPARERGEVEDSAHDQDDDSKEWLPTMSDEGTLKIEAKYSHAQMTRFNAMYDGKGTYTWLATAPLGAAAGTVTAQAFTYKGWVKKVDEFPFEREGVMMFKAEIRVTKKPTRTAGANA